MRGKPDNKQRIEDTGSLKERMSTFNLNLSFHDLSS